MRSLVVILATCTCLVHTIPPPHPDVLAVRHEEAFLHPSLKSPALRNPRLLKILPLTSLLHEGENLVFQRDTNDVSRHEIYKILTHAGLIPRNFRPSIGPSNNDISAVFPEEHIGFHDSIYFPNQDVLQHL